MSENNIQEKLEPTFVNKYGGWILMGGMFGLVILIIIADSMK